MALTLSAIFWGIVTFSLLVVLHEGGHMLTARAFGVKVHEFFIGLPGPSLSFTAKDTRYGITAIPLGGYVRIAGMEGDVNDPLLEPLLSFITLKREVTETELLEQFDIDEKTLAMLLATLADWDAISLNDETRIWSAAHDASLAENPEALMKKAQEHTYLALSPIRRIATLCAGVFVNIICAIAVFTIVLSGWGYYTDLGHVDVIKGGPAAVAGVASNDKISAVDETKIDSFEEIPAVLKKSYKVGDVVTLSVVHAGEERKVNVQLAKNPDTGAPYLGITSHMTHVKPSVGKALSESVGYVGMTLKALAGFFNPSTFKESAAQSSSIVGISVMAAKAAQTSALDYAWLIAAISLSLGIMNLMPIPPLDGGKVVIEIIGALRGKPISTKTQVGVSLAGFALLFALVIFLTYNDFAHILG